MTSFIQNLAGMGDMTEEVIAADFLITAKEMVRKYAMAVTESFTPAVREMLARQMNDAVVMQGKIADYMVAKGYYPADDPGEQLRQDIKAAGTVMEIWQNS